MEYIETICDGGGSGHFLIQLRVLFKTQTPRTYKGSSTWSQLSSITLET